MASKMSSNSRPTKIAVSPLIILFVLLNLSVINKCESKCFESIISFGDSLADTGNLIVLRPPEKDDLLSDYARPPYGRTFFHHPTGRCSDGRLVIDFLAESLGLPFVQPIAGYLSRQNFSGGVNLAVAGATAIDHRFLEERGIYNPITNVSLGTQLDWFKQFLTTIPGGRKFLKNSLVLMGEIGGNDYNYYITQGKTIKEAQSHVPLVVNHIGLSIQELIELGAQTILVPGTFSFGCSPNYLTQFKMTSSVAEYDPKTGCLNNLNKFTKYHNELLQKELSRIRGLHPHVNLIYGDYYNVVMQFYLSPTEHGFNKGVLKACCGVGGPYNYNSSTPCGTPPATSCDDPSSFISWDGIHLTEAAYRLIARALLEGPYTFPHFKTICPSLAIPVTRLSQSEAA